jgi:hypothetical protein
MIGSKGFRVEQVLRNKCAKSSVELFDQFDIKLRDFIQA